MTSTRSKSRKSQKSSEKENSAFSNSSQSTKFPRESLFDFNDSDEEQFDVKSSKRSFRVKKGSNSDTGIKSKKDLKGSKKRAPKSVAGGSKAKENTHQKQEKKTSSVHKDDLAVSSSIYQTKTSDLPEKKYNRHIDISIVSNEDFLCDKEIQHNKDGEKKKLDGPIATKEEVLRMATSTDNLDREPKTIVFKGNSENTEDAIESHVNVKINIEKNASDKCPLCLKNFPASSTDYEMNMHVNACLDGENGNDNARSIANTPKLTNAEKNKVSIAKMDDKEISDEKMAKILQEREDEKAVEENLTRNLHFCAICQKDLNHLSTDSRQIHLNKCADISEKETASIRKAEIKSAKENSKQFECIICGLLFSTMQQKISHMKQCSRENKVDQRELLKIVKETSEKSLNAVLMSSQKESGSALDGSNSKKQRFHKRKGKSRRKIRNEEIPVLLTRSEADAKKIAASIANRIVMEQMRVPACLDKENKTSFPQSSLERKYCKNAKDAEIISSALTVEAEGGTEETKSEHPIELKPFQKKRLWDLADNSKSLGETACFYVVEIFGDDYIRTKKRLTMKANTHGAELQKHHAFDDVDREILCDSDKDEETVSRKQFSNIPSREEALNQSFALTQSEKTAIIENLGKTFADVCDNDDDTPIDKSRESKDMDIEENDNDLGSGFVRNEISDYKDHKQDEMRLSKFRNLKENVQVTLISNMKSLLQDVISSDMKIMCANGKETQAHKCILFARCPQMRTEQSQMDLTDFSVEAVKFFLEFIYYGEIDVRPEVAVEVFKLASRYSMDPLAEACLMLGNEAELKDVDFCEESYSKNTNVDEVMKNLLADDDYDDEEEDGDEYARTDSETKVDENVLGIGDSPFNESDEEDLREFFVTQRVRRNSLEDDVDSEKSDLNELAQLAPDDTLDNQNLIRGDDDNDCNDFDSNDCEDCDRSDDNDCCVDGNDTAPGRDVDDRDDDGVVYDCDDCDVDNERDDNEEDLEVKRKSCDNKKRIFVSVDDSSEDSKYSERDGTSPKQSLSQNRMLPSDAVTSVRSLRSLNVTSNGDESISCNKEEDTEMQEWEKRIEVEKCSTSLASRINEDSITFVKDDNDKMEIIGDDDDQNKGLINESLSSICCDLTDDQTPNQFQNKSVEGRQNNSEDEDYFGTSSDGLNFTLHLEEDDEKKEAPEMGNRKSGDNKSDIFLVTPSRQTPQLLENTFATPALYSAGTFSNPGDQWNTGEGGVLPFSKRGSSSRRSDCMSNASDQKEVEESPYARRPIKGKASRLGDINQKETMKIQSSGSEEGEKRIPVGRGYTAKKQLLVDLSRDIDVELHEPEESIEGESPVKCLSGSELQNKSVLLEPLSPCVTTSQFERKGKGNDKEEQADYLKSVSTNLPLLSQRNVIDVDADDQDDIDEISISRSSNKTGNNQATPRRSDSFFDDAMSDTFDVMELNPHALDTSGECVARADSSHSDVIDITDSTKQARCARNRLDFEMSEGSSDEVIDTTPKKKNDTSQYTTSFNSRNISSSQKSEGKSLDGEGQAHKQTNGSRRRKREDRADDFSDSEEKYPSRKLGMTPRKSFSKRGRREGSPQSITLQKSIMKSAKDVSNMQRVECMLNESSSSLKSDIDIPNENNHSEHLEELSPLCLDMSKGPQRYAENSPMDKSELNAVHLKAEPENDNITGSLPSSMHSFNDDGGFNPDLDFGVQTQTDNKAHVETRLSDAHFQIRSSPHSLLTGESKAHSATFEEIAEVRDDLYEMEDEENNDFSDCYIDDGGFNCDVPQDLNQISNISNTVLHVPDIDVSSDESLTFPIVATNKGSKMYKTTLSDNIGSIREYQGEQHVSREDVNLKEQDVGRKEDANNSLDRELSNSQNSKHTASSVTPVRSSMQTMKTPNTALRNFGPGCKVHPETGASITPMSDYDTLHTPDLTKRVKNFGMRKLPKHQMAGKLREIYKVNHGFAHWEEPPTKAHRKRKANVKTKKKVTNEPNEKASSTNKQQGNESEENSHSVERNDQSDTEHSSSSADERQKTFEGIDCSDDEKSSQTSQNEETQSDESISEKLSRFMKSNKDFYHKILTYQKLSFEDIYKAVKEAKLKCTKARLMDFLDDQCICVVFPKADDQARPQRKRWKKR